ncbi:Nn.00g105980.m01.CDS01 [Neocucurbitaria sp. VM-36]
MPGLKRKVDESTSVCEERSTKKQPTPSNASHDYELQEDPKNYGTAASQRPRRSTRPQLSVVTTVPPTYSLKPKRRQGRATPKSKQKHVAKKSRPTGRTTPKQLASSKAQPQPGLHTEHTELPATEKSSSVVPQDNPLDLGPRDKDVPSRRSTRLQKGTELENTRVSQPVSEHKGASRSASQADLTLTQEWTRTLSVSQSPGERPSSLLHDDAREAFETPPRVPPQDKRASFTPLTPESMPRPVRLDPLPSASIAAPQIALEVNTEATTLQGDTEADIYDRSISDERLYTIADQLFAHRKGTFEKPEPSGQPEVWADGRQELCETLHYYRAYQGACYSTGGFVRGFMFDKIAHARDYIDSNVVISRAGGGLIKDKDSGEMRSGRDQLEDTVAHNLRNCMRHYNPVVIITGVDNPHIPSKPPQQYCVLDYFKPTYIWIEKSGGSKIVRYRFEKLNIKKDSWWRPKDKLESIELGSLPPPIKKACKTCGVLSLQIYLNGWMCLQPACLSFWTIAQCGTQPYEPDEESLVYDPRFLKQKTTWPNDDHEYPLVSNNAVLSGYSIPGEDTSQAFWLGVVCPDCGRCNSRLSWMGWECQNPACGFKREPPHTLIPAVSLREPLWPLTSEYTLSRDTQAPLIGVHVSFVSGYRMNRYTIPGIDGFITHMIANKAVLEEPGGPDTMFEELQHTDIGLRRRSMPNGQLKGPNYCRHFAVNYGMPYKFIAATASQSFEDASRPIIATRSRLNWAARLLLAQESNCGVVDVEKERKENEFNEVLALGYFEQQKINYHDDGEYGLGPTIATLSLGAPGTMRIRMKARHYHGVSSAGVYDDAPPLPGCQQYEARLAMQPSLDALQRSDSRAYTARRKAVPQELKLKCSGNAKDVLNMQLGHGDIVVMHGAEMQRYYEHAVEHAGKLRFALTCRYIDPESLKEADKPDYEVGPDTEGYDGSGLA